MEEQKTRWRNRKQDGGTENKMEEQKKDGGTENKMGEQKTRLRIRIRWRNRK